MNHTPNSTTTAPLDAIQAGEPDNLLDLLAATPRAVEAESGTADGDAPSEPVDIAACHASMASDLLEILTQIAGVDVTPTVCKLGTSLDERFETFHAENPHVYAALRTLAFQDVRIGATRLSMQWATEYLRKTAIRTNGYPWLIDNSYRPYFVRLLELNEPALRGLYELRPSRADAWIIRYAAEQAGLGRAA